MDYKNTIKYTEKYYKISRKFYFKLPNYQQVSN